MSNPKSETQKQFCFKEDSTNHRYKKVNAYTHRASVQQILTFLLFSIQFAMHCVFLIRPIFEINHGLLYFIWAILLLFISAVIVDYIILTCQDPADKLLVSPEEIEGWKVMQMLYQKKKSIDHIQNSNRQLCNEKINNNPYLVKFCKTCKGAVKKNSYHCWTCNRCVENLDHHCKYLNNCIGSRNYSSFFRMLCCVSLYLVVSAVIGLWVFIAGLNDSNIDSLTFSKWAALIFFLLSMGLFILVQTLLWFHCYISCYLRITTIEYLFRDTPSNNGSESTQKQNKSERSK